MEGREAVSYGLKRKSRRIRGRRRGVVRFRAGKLPAESEPRGNP